MKKYAVVICSALFYWLNPAENYAQPAAPEPTQVAAPMQGQETSPMAMQSGEKDVANAQCPNCGQMMKMKQQAMPFMMIGGSLLFLAVLAVLVALTIFLIRRSRV